jgi:mannose-6-phosphate isomerase-like protein (cupin superfamily)
VLSPGEAVGLHSTGEAEEVVVPLSGAGELRVPGQEPLEVCPGRILYNPPHTPHDIVNTGDEEMRYVYIVAKA